MNIPVRSVFRFSSAFLPAVILMIVAGCGYLNVEQLQLDSTADDGAGTGERPGGTSPVGTDSFDTATADTATADVGPTDTGTNDTGTVYSGTDSFDTATADTGTTDTGTRDTETKADSEVAGTDTDSTTETAPVAYCNELPYMNASPVLDGVIEAGIHLEFFTPVGWTGSEPIPAQTGAQFAAAWREDGLYFFLDVTDPDRNPSPPDERVWKGDGVEIYVDHDAAFDTPPPGFDEFGTRHFMVEAPADEVTPGARGVIRPEQGVYNPWNPLHWISIPTPTGYAVEAFVSGTDLDIVDWVLRAGNQVGFDLAQNVSFPPGQIGPDLNRLGQYFLQIREPPQGNVNDYPHTNESVFCTPTLLAP